MSMSSSDEGLSSLHHPVQSIQPPDLNYRSVSSSSMASSGDGTAPSGCVTPKTQPGSTFHPGNGTITSPDPNLLRNTCFMSTTVQSALIENALSPGHPAQSAQSEKVELSMTAQYGTSTSITGHKMSSSSNTLAVESVPSPSSLVPTSEPGNAEFSIIINAPVVENDVPSVDLHRTSQRVMTPLATDIILPGDTNKKISRRGHFPFMELPPELRAMVYSFALVDDAKQMLGRGVWADVKHEHTTRPDWLPAPTHNLMLLAVNREINAEALPTMMSQPFKFDGIRALQAMLELMGPGKRALVRHVVLTRWDWYSNDMASNIRTAQLLSEIETLKRVEIYHVSSAFGSSSEQGAKEFFDQAGVLLRTIGSRRHRKDAGLEVIRFHYISFGLVRSTREGNIAKATFETELKRLVLAADW